MEKKIKDVLNIATTVILLVCTSALIGKLIFEITIMAKLKYPSECVIINGEYYCREVKKTQDKGVEM